MPTYHADDRRRRESGVGFSAGASFASMMQEVLGAHNFWGYVFGGGAGN